MINEQAHFFQDSPPWQTENVSCQPLSYYIFKTRIYHSICSSIRTILSCKIFVHTTNEWHRCALFTGVEQHSHHFTGEKKEESISKWYFFSLLLNSIACVVLVLNLIYLTFHLIYRCEILYILFVTRKNREFLSIRNFFINIEVIAVLQLTFSSKQLIKKCENVYWLLLNKFIL